MTRRRDFVCALSIILITLAVGTSQAETAMKLFLGDKLIDHEISMPAVLSEDVCVPVRQFAEATGAVLDWDGGAGTLTVSDSSRIGVLRVGSRIATVGGVRIFLPHAPYIVDGLLYAPSLFFNEAFDQAWVWDPLTRQFTWMPIFPRWQGTTTPKVIFGPGRRTMRVQTAPALAGRVITSEVASVEPSSTNPKISIRTDSKIITYSVAMEALIIRGRIGELATEASLGDILPGDRVRLQFDELGIVTSIRAQYRIVMGMVRSVMKDGLVLSSSETLEAADQVEVILPGNVQGDLQDIRIGDHISARVGLVTGRAYVIKVLSPNLDEQVIP